VASHLSWVARLEQGQAWSPVIFLYATITNFIKPDSALLNLIITRKYPNTVGSYLRNKLLYHIFTVIIVSNNMTILRNLEQAGYRHCVMAKSGDFGVEHGLQGSVAYVITYHSSK